MTDDITVHPAAAVFPRLPDDELAALADDIAANGLLHPIVVDEDGAILDGINRHAACMLASVDPIYETYHGDPVALVLSANVSRRHMTTGARAMATAVILAADGKRRDGKWTYGAIDNITNSGSSDGTWRNAMTQAGVVIDVTPEVAPAVVAGAISLHAAHTKALDERAKAETFEARFARLPDDLVAQVREENLTLDDAEAVVRQREQRRTDERRDARTLLTRILDLAAPAEPASDFIDAWATRLGPVEPEVVDRIDDAIHILTNLVKRVRTT